MTTIQESQSLLTQTVYTGQQAVSAIVRLKGIIHTIAPQKYPNGRRHSFPMNTLMPTVDDFFLKTVEGKAIKKAVQWLYYHQVFPVKSKVDLFTYFNEKVKKGMSYGEARTQAMHSLGKTALSLEQKRITALFTQLVNIIHPELKKYLKKTDHVEGHNLLTTLEQLMDQRFAANAFKVTAPKVIKKAKQLQKELNVRLTQTNAVPFLLTLSKEEGAEDRTLFINPSCHTVYDDSVGVVLYGNNKALLADLNKQLEAQRNREVSLRTIKKL